MAMPNPITRENFPKAWKYVCRKYRWATKKNAVRRIAAPVGHLLFFPGFLMLALDALFTFSPAQVRSFLGKYPFLTGLWQRWEALVFANAETVGQKIGAACLVLYGIPFAAFLVVAVLVVLLRRVRLPEPGSNDRQNAETMWTLSRHAQVHAWRSERDISGTLSIITGVLAALAVLFMCFNWLIVPGGVNLIGSMSLTENLKFFALAVILIFSYGLVDLPLAGLMKLVHYCHVPKNLPHTAELYVRSLGSQSAPVNKEEAPAAPVQADSAPEKVSEENTPS